MSQQEVLRQSQRSASQQQGQSGPTEKQITYHNRPRELLLFPAQDQTVDT